MKRNFGVIGVLSLLFISALSPTQSYATNGHQLSAIGAYQEGLGGAVTAAPYDVTTAITNPGGMALIGCRADFSFELLFPKRSVEFMGGIEETGGSPMYMVPAVGWNAPISERNDWFFGGGMYVVSGMGVDFGTVSVPPLNAMYTNPKASIWSQYQFWKLAPTISYKADKLAIGFAANIDYQALGFKQVFTGSGAGQRFGFDLSTMQGTMGYGATIGAVYEISPQLSVGATYSTKQIFGDFKWRLREGDVIPSPLAPIANQDGMYKMRLDFPQQAAVGIAVRPTKKLLWTLDGKWINFSDTYDAPVLRGTFSGGVSEVSLPFGWDDVWVIATGLQYEVNPNFVVRVGYNHSNSPIKEEDVENNVAFPAIVEDRISGGFTYRFGRHWETTFAYMQALKRELTGPVNPPFQMGTKVELEEKATHIEISYRF